MEDVGRQKAIDVDWRFFSLRKINEGRDLPERFRVSHLMGLRAVRVAAAVREQHGREAVRTLYTVMGMRKHHDQADIGTVTELESILSSFAQWGINPQRIITIRFGLLRMITGTS